MKPTSLEQFYNEVSQLLPEGISREIGHFNIFKIADLVDHQQGRAIMPYNRRSYFKVSLINGRNRAEYADKVIEIENTALLFATPRVPYNWVPVDQNQSGSFCIFTEEFMIQSKSGVNLADLPLYQPGGYPLFHLSSSERDEVAAIFDKMFRELDSDYVYKYDLLRNYVLELIHFGQKLQPLTAMYPRHTAAARVTSLFAELLERQFPIESPRQRLQLKTAGDYADTLAVHVNHLNKVLKDSTGKTTTEIISSRIIQEAKVLLKQTDWNISEIAYSLGFEEIAHFSNFFRKKTSFSPIAFRS